MVGKRIFYCFLNFRFFRNIPKFPIFLIFLNFPFFAKFTFFSKFPIFPKFPTFFEIFNFFEIFLQIFDVYNLEQDGIGSRFEDEPEDEVEEESTAEVELPAEQVPVLATAFGIDIRQDGTAAFAEYVDDRFIRLTGFGDQDFDEAARNLGKIIE